MLRSACESSVSTDTYRREVPPHANTSAGINRRRGPVPDVLAPRVEAESPSVAAGGAHRVGRRGRVRLVIPAGLGARGSRVLPPVLAPSLGDGRRRGVVLIRGVVWQHFCCWGIEFGGNRVMMLVSDGDMVPETVALLGWVVEAGVRGAYLSQRKPGCRARR